MCVGLLSFKINFSNPTDFGEITLNNKNSNKKPTNIFYFIILSCDQ